MSLRDGRGGMLPYLALLDLVPCIGIIAGSGKKMFWARKDNKLTNGTGQSRPTRTRCDGLHKWHQSGPISYRQDAVRTELYARAIRVILCTYRLRNHIASFTHTRARLSRPGLRSISVSWVAVKPLSGSSEQADRTNSSASAVVSVDRRSAKALAALQIGCRV